MVIDPASHWGDDERVQGGSFQILGLPHDGTYAELVAVPVEQLHEKPGHLSVEEAAAIPLASLTAYRALVSRAHVAAGETVVVTGIGGGVATCAPLIGTRLGAKVYVTSGSDAKLDAARTHGGPRRAVNHSDPAWPKALIAQIGGRPTWLSMALGAIRSTRRWMCWHRGGGWSRTAPRWGSYRRQKFGRIFWKQLSVLGSTMGTPRDFKGMLQLYRDGLRPIVDQAMPLDRAADAHRRMEEGNSSGRSS